jgi:hypothetical protein
MCHCLPPNMPLPWSVAMQSRSSASGEPIKLVIHAYAYTVIASVRHPVFVQVSLWTHHRRSVTNATALPHTQVHLVGRNRCVIVCEAVSVEAVGQSSRGDDAL